MSGQDSNKKPITGKDVTIGFGKHKGKKLHQLSDNYLVWCITNMESGTATWKMLKGEIERRDALDAVRGRCGRVSRCPENQRAENKQDTSFLILTGPKSMKNRPDIDVAPGEMSPFGIRYPSDWAKLTKGQRKAWKKHAAGLQSASKPKEPLNLADRVKKSNHSPITHVKPAIPQTSADEISASKFANVARAKELGVNGAVEITADECPY